MPRSHSRSRSQSASSRSHSRSRSRSRSRRSRSGGGGGGGGGAGPFSDGPPGTRLHVGDLGPDPSKSELERAFAKFGRIREVFISSTIPHFAFVQFESVGDASEALKEMNGKSINGARIRVSPARPRREDRFGSGGGGGGGPPRSGPGGPCFACGEFGHFARECPRDRRGGGGGDRYGGSNGGSRGSASFGRNYFPSSRGGRRSRSGSRSHSRSRSRSGDHRRSRRH